MKKLLKPKKVIKKTKKSILIEQKVKPNYNCSQSENYGVAFRVAHSLDEHITEFGANAAMFDIVYTTEFRQSIIAAKNLPNFMERVESQKYFHTKLVDISVGAIDAWKLLKGGIELMYPIKEEQEIMLASAGHQFYKAVSHGGYSQTGDMMVAGKNFLITHAQDMVAAKTISEGFQEDYQAAHTLFVSKYSAYSNEKDTVHGKRNIKIKANNAVHNTIKQVNKYGKIIFAHQEDIRNLFTFEKVLSSITGPGSHLRTFNLDGGTSQNIANAILNSEITNLSDFPIWYCPQTLDNVCNTETKREIKAKESDVMDLESGDICVTNPNPTEKVTFTVRCEKLH